MFLSFAFCPACDLLGKAKVSGLEIVFKSHSFNFTNLMGFLMLASPVVVVLNMFIDLKIPENKKSVLERICFIAAIIFFFLFTVSLPKGVSLAIGSYLYLILSLIGAGITYIHIFVNRK